MSPHALCSIEEFTKYLINKQCGCGGGLLFVVPTNLPPDLTVESDTRLNLDLLDEEEFRGQNKGLSGDVSVSGSCRSGGRDEAVPRMVTQSPPPGCHRQPGKVTGHVCAIEGVCQKRGKGARTRGQEDVTDQKH